MTGVRVTGAEQIAGQLRTVAGQLTTGLPDVEAGMARAMLSAVHPPRRTGALAGTLRVDLSTPGQPGITAGSPGVAYAAVHEWGSPSRGITGRHYVRAGVEASQAAWLGVYTAGVQARLNTIT